MPSRLAQIVEHSEEALISQWAKQQLELFHGQSRRISESELRSTLHGFVVALKQGLASGGTKATDTAAWSGMRDLLTNLPGNALAGFSPAETACSFSSRPSFAELGGLRKDPAGLAEDQTTTDLPTIIYSRPAAKTQRRSAELELSTQ
jgi:hypothetical protein